MQRPRAPAMLGDRRKVFTPNIQRKNWQGNPVGVPSRTRKKLIRVFDPTDSRRAVAPGPNVVLRLKLLQSRTKALLKLRSGDFLYFCKNGKGAYYAEIRAEGKGQLLHVTNKKIITALDYLTEK
jgi:hypothetical protein